MISPPTFSRLTLIALLAAGAVTGCSTIQPAQTAPDPHQQTVLALMDECLAQQARTAAQLQTQSTQLQEQQAQLQTLSSQIAEVSARPAPAEQPSAPAPVCIAPPEEPGKLVVGQMEKIWLPNIGIELQARVDTGAETSSLDARNIELFERNSSRWVRFQISHPETGEMLELERKLRRRVLIVQSNSAEPERRPVVQLSITLGHLNQTAEFTLSDRSHLDYQLLVGRNILQDVMVVDVSKKNVAPYAAESATDTRDPAGS